MTNYNLTITTFLSAVGILPQCLRNIVCPPAADKGVVLYSRKDN